MPTNLTQPVQPYTDEDVETVARAVWESCGDVAGYEPWSEGSDEDHEDARSVARVVLAALAEAGRLLPAEAVARLRKEIAWQRQMYGDGKDKVATGRLIGMEDALRTISPRLPADPTPEESK